MTAILIIMLVTNIVGWFFVIGALCNIDNLICTFVKSFVKYFKKGE